MTPELIGDVVCGVLMTALVLFVANVLLGQFFRGDLLDGLEPTTDEDWNVKR